QSSTNGAAVRSIIMRLVRTWGWGRTAAPLCDTARRFLENKFGRPRCGQQPHTLTDVSPPASDGTLYVCALHPKRRGGCVVGRTTGGFPGPGKPPCPRTKATPYAPSP